MNREFWRVAAADRGCFFPDECEFHELGHEESLSNRAEVRVIGFFSPRGAHVDSYRPGPDQA